LIYIDKKKIMRCHFITFCGG